MALSWSWVSSTQAGNTEYSGERVGLRPSAVSRQVSEQMSNDARELLECLMLCFCFQLSAEVHPYRKRQGRTSCVGDAEQGGKPQQVG